MKSKRHLIASIFQLIVGIFAISAIIYAWINGEDIAARWTLTAILALAYVVLGVIGIIDYYRHD